MRLLDRLFDHLPNRQRESAAERAAWIDSTVQTIGTRVAESTALAALRARDSKRSFEAAETPAWVESWPTHAAPINDDLARQMPTLRARARGMARNNEWATNYLIKLDDNVLGAAGIVLQMRLKKRDGTPDKTTNDRLEAAWARWCERADVSGMCWREVESLALAGGPQDGELLYRHRPGAGPLGFQIQLLPPDLLDEALRRDYSGHRVRMGVEIDDDGIPLYYWLRAAKAGDQPHDNFTVGAHLRVPVSEIKHFFVRREIGQLRGFPWLSAGARRLWLLRDFEESAAVASTNAAKRQGFFTTGDGEAPTGFADRIVSSVLETARAQGKVLTPDEIQAITASAQKFSTTMPGQFDTLPEGGGFVPFESKWPDVSADGYVKQQIRGWAAARGMSYVSLGNDLEAVNYSSARVGIIEEREHYKTLQTQLVRWLHAPVFAAVLPYLILDAGLDSAAAALYLAAATWQPRRWKGIDPVKEAAADETNLKLKLTSRRRLILERGDDPDEIAAEVAVEDALYGAIPSSSAATKPPADEPDEDDDAKKGTAND